MGATFCVLFAWWFVSGVFMVYWDYPGINSAERLRRSPVLTPSSVQLSPSEAFARLGISESPEAVRLNSFDGRPAYRFGVDGKEWVVFADSGERPELSSSAISRRTAASWTEQPGQAATVQILTEADQWTVPESFGPLRPLWKYSWPNGEDVYVSQVTGEVAQHTTRGSRIQAYLGPIPHWLYFTPLRKHERLWSRIVIWSSGLATVAALLGLIAGVWVYWPSKRIPYSGQKRLHMILGLFFGVVACTWSFSGMLSLDPFAQGRDDGAAALADALRGHRFELAAFGGKHPRQALAQIGSGLKVKELQLTFFAGQAVYLAMDGRQSSKIVPVHGEPRDAFEPDRLLEAIRAASQPAGLLELRLISEYDAYYLDRDRKKPLPVILAQWNDSQGTRYYVDPRTAQIVGAYSSRMWVSRWLYHGLHSIDLPWLYNHRPAWDAVILVLLLGGTWLSVTAVILGFRLLRRKLARFFPNFSHP